MVSAFPMVVSSILPHAEFGPDDHQEDAHHLNLLIAFIFLFIARWLHLNSSMFCLFSWRFSFFRNWLVLGFVFRFLLIDFHFFFFGLLFDFDFLCFLLCLCFSLFSKERINLLVWFWFLGFLLNSWLFTTGSFFLDRRWFWLDFRKGFCYAFLWCLLKLK